MRTKIAHNGMVVAPHHLAASAGANILRVGGNAIEAMVAAAATIAVAYPHMNGLGGDNFWLLHTPGSAPRGIDACGAAAALATTEFYSDQGYITIPGRGPGSALTVAGAISGWQRAIDFSQERWAGKIPLADLLAEAIGHARDGVAVSQSLADNVLEKSAELKSVPGFADLYCSKGKPVATGSRLIQTQLASTLEHLAKVGLDDFYRGDLARTMAEDLAANDSPLRLSDLERHEALDVEPLSLKCAGHDVYNLPPPTQGIASLTLLALYERLAIQEPDNFEYVHGLVEATKCAFEVRDRYICDPDHMTVDPQALLASAALDEMAATIDRQNASSWPRSADSGDTVWLGAVDGEGRAVSFIQSIYWEFGSGFVLPQSGITWQNRGTSFALDPNHHNCLLPGKRPFHTIQPALAHLSDGRVMAYGTMGGDGQPQTQAMMFSRHVLHGQDLQQAISAPRWLLGRTWGSEATNLRIENRFDALLYNQLREAGHDIEVIGDFDSVMGHAGALVGHPDGLIEGAWDPRSDGAAVSI
jgi:gamma-glutamyltranspeptidase/glutathione hydrolase